MDQPPRVQKVQRPSQPDAKFDDFAGGQALTLVDHLGEGEGSVRMPIGDCHWPTLQRWLSGTIRFRTSDFGLRISGGAGRIVRQLHHVVEEAASLVLPDLKHIYQTLVLARDGFVALNAGELAVVGPGVGKAGAADDLHRPECAEFRPGQPDFAVAAVRDLPQELVARDRGRAFGTATKVAAGRFRCTCRGKQNEIVTPWAFLRMSKLLTSFPFACHVKG